VKGGIVVAWILLIWWLSAGPAQTKSSAREIPKTWDEAALANSATPLCTIEPAAHAYLFRSLVEMFDPNRLKETHVPGGWAYQHKDSCILA
jgi:hypothetical protein